MEKRENQMREQADKNYETTSDEDTQNKEKSIKWSLTESVSRKSKIKSQLSSSADKRR